MVHSVHDPWNWHLLAALVRRDFKAQYRRSLIGPAWALLYSVIYLLLFIAIRSFLGIPSDGKPYAIFAAVAIVPWTFFSGAVARAGTSIMLNGQLLKKMAVRREILPTAAIILSFVDFAVASIIVIGLAFWFGLTIGWSILLLPIFVLLLAVCALGIGMMVASIGVYKRDIILGLPFVLQIWMLASPIMYPLSIVPVEWRLAYSLNPMVGILEAFRSILLDGALPDLQLSLMAVAGCGLLLLVGWTMFKTLSQYFVDVL
ncbi:ABC transporter permease [Pelagibius litoralis]|uniref:Transport permease protein n=1 Tax=Pelagibius litoralis TaxID=374515 RepID=A0A967EW26_9PROT|nr:ABC transporter permease [Pelagibius litoralis]NIA69079.1 ABC transporter permease [Pelagibius litoralis]